MDGREVLALEIACPGGGGRGAALPFRLRLQLTLLQNRQESAILARTRASKEAQVKIAEENLRELESGRDAATERARRYEKLIAGGRGLPAPALLLARVWPDPSWRTGLPHLVVPAANWVKPWTASCLLRAALLLSLMRATVPATAFGPVDYMACNRGDRRGRAIIAA
ncbi:hypothetical protein [Nonomuraea sp. NPDC049400]|uniref:hypothetical protein n=1 Tax=Nonomuraea sp. NPDC049400 TaxID=3364352 RepID=UPI0037A2FEC5